MRGIIYDAQFYRAEIESIALLLTQPVSHEERLLLQTRLESAKAHLADLTGKGN
jgi:hypothetical protein